MYIDVYGLASTRCANIAWDFLHKFVPNWELCAAPEDFSEVFELDFIISLQDQFQWMEQHPTRSYSHYFHNTHNEDPRHLIVAWNNDGSLVCGLSLMHIANSDNDWLAIIEDHFNSNIIYGTERPPPMYRTEFG